MTRVRLVQRHSRNLLLVHVVWATLGRLPMLELSADEWLAVALRRKAFEAACRLVACGNAIDHVHVLLRYPSTVRLADVVHRLKGASSYDWNASRRKPRLSWQQGYWAESISVRELPTVTDYVDGQRAHHGEARELEAWEVEPGAGHGEWQQADGNLSAATKTESAAEA